MLVRDDPRIRAPARVDGGGLVGLLAGEREPLRIGDRLARFVPAVVDLGGHAESGSGDVRDSDHGEDALRTSASEGFGDGRALDVLSPALGGVTLALPTLALGGSRALP